MFSRLRACWLFVGTQTRTRRSSSSSGTQDALLRGCSKFHRVASGLARHHEVGQLPQPIPALGKAGQCLVCTKTFLFGHLARTLQAVYGGKSDLVLLLVLAGRLAQRFRRHLDVENVVDNLKRKTNVFTVLRQG